MAVFQMNLGYPVPFSFLSALVPEENLQECGTGFLQAGCPSCHPTSSVKALKESQSGEARTTTSFCKLSFAFAAIMAAKGVGHMYCHIICVAIYLYVCTSTLGKPDM